MESKFKEMGYKLNTQRIYEINKKAKNITDSYYKRGQNDEYKVGILIDSPEFNY